MEKLRVVEAFGGIGAWAKALENLGINHEVLNVIEFDGNKMSGYNAIHGSDFVTSDITQLNASEIPDHDVFCYSPPCQSFSVAGNSKGIEDERGHCSTMHCGSLKLRNQSIVLWRMSKD